MIGKKVKFFFVRRFFTHSAIQISSQFIGFSTDYSAWFCCCWNPIDVGIRCFMEQIKEKYTKNEKRSEQTDSNKVI